MAFAVPFFYWRQATSFRLQATGCGPLTANWLLADSYKLQATGCELQAARFILLF